MKPRTRLALTPLEDRTNPALTFTLSGGNLLVAGTSLTGIVNVTQTAPTTFVIQDGLLPPVTKTVTRDLFVQPTNTLGVTVNYNANGQTSPGNVTIRLGNGNNTFNLQNGITTTGAIKGALNVFTGNGDDTLNIGGTDATKQTKFAWLNVGAGNSENDVVNVQVGAVPRGLSIAAAEFVTVVPDVVTDVTSDVNIQFASGLNVLSLQGETKRNVNISVQNVNQSFLLLDLDGKVGGNVDVRGGNFNAFGFMTLDVRKPVAGNISVWGTGGADFVEIHSGVNPANVGVNLYGGANTFLVNSNVNQTIIAYGGGGDDTVTINGTSKYVAFSLGDGDDTLTITANVSININGFMGGGNDIVVVNNGAGSTGQSQASLGVDLGEGDDVITLSGNYKGAINVLGQGGVDTVTLTAGTTVTQETSAGRAWLDFGAGVDVYNNLSGDASLSTDNGTTVRIFNLP